MAPRKLFEKRPLLENPPSASPSEEEEENPDQQPRKETQESEFFSVGEGEREEEKEQEEVEVAKNTTTEEGEEEEEEEINNTTALKEKEEEKPERGGAGNRLWSEDDEITILEGMINYHSKKGTDPYTELGEFHEFIKNSLNVDASNSQFVDKVRKMKVKYNKNLKKAPSKPHDLKCFELSKKIWAVGGGGKQKRNGVNGNGKRRSKRARKTVEKAGYSWGIHPCLKQSLARETETFSFDLSMNEPLKSFMMANMSMIGKVKAKELKKKKKDLLVDEVAMYLRRVELVKEGTELMLEAMKASKD